VDDAEKATASALNRLLCKLLFISRTVEPSDAHCDDRIADDGRGGKGEEKLKTEMLKS
jgi:hypothetical protein